MRSPPGPMAQAVTFRAFGAETHQIENTAAGFHHAAASSFFCPTLLHFELGYDARAYCSFSSCFSRRK